MKFVLFLSLMVVSTLGGTNIDTLSDILPNGKNIEIIVSGSTEGKKGIVSFFSKDDDQKWKGVTRFKVAVNNCFAEQAVADLEKNGIHLKYRTSDGFLVGYRESIRWLKDQGAQYIFLSNYDVDSKEPKNFKEALEFMLEKSDREFFDLINLTYAGGATQGRVLPIGCFRGGFEARDLVFFAGQVVSLAVGVAGAKSANTSMTSLAAHSSVATNNITNLQKKTFQNPNGNGNISKDANENNAKVNFKKPDWLQDGNKDVIVETDPKRLSGIARISEIEVVGIIDKNLYAHKGGFVFSVDEVEQALDGYKKIPYELGKIQHN